VIVLRVPTAIDLHKSGVIWVAAGNRVVLELTKVTGERNVLSAGDVLVPEEQHLIFQEQRIDFRHQHGIA